MASFLITGGLPALDQRVMILDDLSSGHVRNIAHLRSDPRLEFAPESVTTRGVLAGMVAGAGVFNIIENPVATIENNIGGTRFRLCHQLQLIRDWFLEEKILERSVAFNHAGG